MPDLLVPLYNLPARSGGEGALGDTGVNIRRANPFELTLVVDFIRHEFTQGWADETAVTFGHQPIACFIATHNRKVIGFAAIDSVKRGFFGPTGVAKEHRGKGIGKALLIAALWGLHDLGYGYGIIGSAGPVDFYVKTVNGIVIPDSSPGVYTDMLDRQ